MKKFWTTTITLVCTALFSFAAKAAWYEVEGVATISTSKSTARMNALEDAIYKAMSFTGADIGTISFLQPYIEESREEYQFTNHEVRYIRVEEEDDSGGKMRLKVRLDIYPTARGCHIDQYKKTILVGKIDLVEPQHAVMGAVYNLGEDYGQVLNRQFEQESQSFTSVGVTPYNLDKNRADIVKMIAQDNGAQYLISGHIHDLTATIESRLLQDDQINRQFAMEVLVFDGQTGNEVFTKTYREVALWPFPKTSQVDTKGARFWSSTYGEMMLRVSRNVMIDLESELSCKITVPSVVAVRQNLVTMDLGRRHGVKKGDKLQLWHNGSFIDQNGIARNRVSQSRITLTVDRVYDLEADLIVDQPELAQSIQIGDVMHKQFDEEE
ncbi:flagellar assembly protein FlgT [Vibrio sp. SCSIO 43136]|uniref:flagellar assembly protein FlgT n=1 Tax=Vibrio sp. SCSIO 43136 TaxID=2819101 RepID=UPI002074FB4A|nr:flagellar assembly protein FlgT [Vibrio sp. SCSIO 43136]USD64617.1 flagella assembly protein FlgT [Vibrio sp. SCSIO 43136]